ncbi:MAG: hypothetical protein NTZ92_05335 [Candidatus Omnitrophica bacterium]|nr:hypothetical protein [Candidatus Omnitrophota bacterium]
MKKILLLLVIGLFLSGCATESLSTLSTLQRRSIEAKELEGNFDDAFKATLQVLQDKGYVIKSTDYKAGVIQGETGEKDKGWWTYYRYEVTATIEQFGEDQVKERITFLKKSGTEGLVATTSKIIEDPKFLQEIYGAIQKEMFVRKNLNK